MARVAAALVSSATSAIATLPGYFSPSRQIIRSGPRSLAGLPSGGRGRRAMARGVSGITWDGKEWRVATLFLSWSNARRGYWGHRLLYDAYELQRSWLNSASDWAAIGAELLNNPSLPMGYFGTGPIMA